MPLLDVAGCLDGLGTKYFSFAPSRRVDLTLWSAHVSQRNVFHTLTWPTVPLAIIVIIVTMHSSFLMVIIGKLNVRVELIYSILYKISKLLIYKIFELFFILIKSECVILQI